MRLLQQVIQNKKQYCSKAMKKKNQKVNKWIYWLPRAFSMLFILFLTLFSLDIFGNNYTFWETILGLLMHNIPSIILTILLIIAWKYELVGAIAFTLAGLLYIVQIIINSITVKFEWYYLSWAFTIAGPAFLTGILFYVNWKLKKKLIKTNKKKTRKIKK
mgnify:CR=1 FL=1